MLRVSERLQELVERIDEAPGWLRPGLYGAGMVALFIVQRGGMVVLPILFIYLAFAHPQDLPRAGGIILGALAAGFAGGLFYGLVGLLVGSLGRPGKVFQFIAGTWVYCVVGVFVIIPLVAPSSSTALSAGENWAVATGMGLFFGGIIGVVATSA